MKSLFQSKSITFTLCSNEQTIVGFDANWNKGIKTQINPPNDYCHIEIGSYDTGIWILL